MHSFIVLFIHLYEIMIFFADIYHNVDTGDI